MEVPVFRTAFQRHIFPIPHPLPRRLCVLVLHILSESLHRQPRTWRPCLLFLRSTEVNDLVRSKSRALSPSLKAANLVSSNSSLSLELHSKHGKADSSEPFRFTSTPAGRSASPLPHSSSLPSVASTTPRKVLTKNPNGVYRWEGAGSAKRSRNRYHSPAFGPSRSTPDRLKLGASLPDQPPVPRMDSKRRRLGEDAASSSASSSGADLSNGHPVHAKTPSPPPRASAPAPSPTRAAQACPFPSLNSPLSPSPTTNGTSNQSQNKTNGGAPSRLRIPQKPTTPVIPSPLRQTWSQQGDGSPSQAGSSSEQPQRQTMAANFMTELIKEVTPPKRPDVSNPYQTASPVKPTPSSRPKPKRARATGKPTTPPGRDAEQMDNKEDAKTEKPLSEYSPQAIIEATLPKV